MLNDYKFLFNLIKNGKNAKSFVNDVFSGSMGIHSTATDHIEHMYQHAVNGFSAKLSSGMLNMVNILYIILHTKI